MLQLEEYFSSLQPTLRSLGKANDVHITIGNESCDLDSIACAISHAYFLASRESGVISLPVLQCSSTDFVLRTDAVWLFEQLKIDPSQLLYCNEVMGMLKAVRKVFVTMVDHATPTRLLTALPNMEVVQVIDHHLETPLVGCHNLVEAVGSCATLVAETLLGAGHLVMPAAIATLLLGAIMVDTVCLDAEQGRVSDKDRAMAEALGDISGISAAHLYANLSKARFAVCGLSVDQLLRKDLKCCKAGGQCLGFSSVPCLVDELLEREGVEEGMHTLCCSLGLSALVVLGVKMETGSITRQIAVYQPQGSDLADAVAGVLESDPDLDCRHLPAKVCILLGQGNTRRSRKHILPTVVTFISSLDLDETNKEADLLQPSLVPTSMVKVESEVETVPEYSLEEESRDVRSHRSVSIDGEECMVDMDTIPEDYPARRYVVSVVQRLAVDDYVIVYLHSGAPQHSMPSINIFHKFYRMVDRRLRKQLQHLFIVHPTLWVNTMLKLARPFISSKFYSKVHLVHSLQQLTVPLQHHLIPAPVVLADSTHQPRPSQPSKRYTAAKSPPASNAD